MRLLLFLAYVLFSTTILAQDWMSDFEDAKTIASEKDQNILLVFSGSDWCAPCIKLEKAIWHSQEFKDYSKDHIVLLKADFPRKKKNKLTKDQQNENDQLAESYNSKGFFPLVVMLDKNGNVLGKTGYKNLPPDEYIDLLASLEL